MYLTFTKYIFTPNILYHLSKYHVENLKLTHSNQQILNLKEKVLLNHFDTIQLYTCVNDEAIVFCFDKIKTLHNFIKIAIILKMEMTN